jgi:hypothetical protein
MFYGSNVNLTVGQFVDAIETSIINGLRMMVLLFWITYNHWSRHQKLRHKMSS